MTWNLLPRHLRDPVYAVASSLNDYLRHFFQSTNVSSAKGPRGFSGVDVLDKFTFSLPTVKWRPRIGRAVMTYAERLNILNADSLEVRRLV